jgi:hypothetical protein
LNKITFSKIRDVIKRIFKLIAIFYLIFIVFAYIYDEFFTDDFSQNENLPEELYLDDKPTTTTTLYPKDYVPTWDEMYPVCSDPIRVFNDYVSWFSVLDIEFNTPFFNYLNDDSNQEMLKKYCRENFSHDPVESGLYIYSAKWLEEIYELSSWIRATQNMCENYPTECVGYGDEYNFDYNFLTLSPAFNLIDEHGSQYSCWIETQTSLKLNIENSRYVRFTGSHRYINNVFEEGKGRSDINRVIGNQYIRSSVLFPKPDSEIKDGDTDYHFNPELNWDFRSIISEPQRLWECLNKANSISEKHQNSPWVIYAYGPPIIRGEIDFNSVDLNSNAQWYVWSVVEPGPESIIKEYPISELYWFNSIITTVEFCNNYELDKDYLKAKENLGVPDDLDIFTLDFVENINFKYVTSSFCESRLKYYEEYP